MATVSQSMILKCSRGIHAWVRARVDGERLAFCILMFSLICRNWICRLCIVRLKSNMHAVFARCCELIYYPNATWSISLAVACLADIVRSI